MASESGKGHGVVTLDRVEHKEWMKSQQKSNQKVVKEHSNPACTTTSADNLRGECISLKGFPKEVSADD